MSFSPVKRSWFSRHIPFAPRVEQTPSRRPAVARPSFRPSLEALEDRVVPSTTPVGDTTVFPESAIVRILTTFPNGDTVQGTGTMVSANTVLTAGHVVYNYADRGSTNSGYATKIEVIAGLNGTNKPYGIAYGTRDETFTSFMADDKSDSNGHSAGDGDIGFISLNRDLGGLTGWLGFMGTSGSNYNVNKYGYPGTGGYNGSQMYHDFGALNEFAAGTVSGFSYWGWSSSSMSAIPGESGSSLILDQNGQMDIIGVQDLGPLSGSGEGYAEVTTQAVINALASFEDADLTAMPIGSLVLTGAPPATVIAGNSFGLTISAEDGYGNVLPTYNGTVYLRILSSPSGASFGGTYSASAFIGVANFSGLSLNMPGTYTLLATNIDMNSATTEAITVEPLPPPPPPPVLSPPPVQSPPINNPPNNNPPTYNPPTYNPPTGNPPPPPPYSSPPPPPSPMQLFFDGYTLGIDLIGSGGLSAVMTDSALMQQINAAPGGFFNPYLDAGLFAALSAL